MHKILLPILVIFALTMTACKRGCTDNLALNFDSKIKYDDGSCRYYADNLVGIYKGSYKTRTYNYLTNSFDVDSANISFNAEKLGINNNIIFFNNLFQRYNFPASFTIVSDTFGIIDTFDYPFIYSAGFKYKADTLFYNTSTYKADENLLLETRIGYGIKQ